MLANKNTIYLRSLLVFYVFMILAFVVLGRILKLQFIENNQWENKNQNSFFKYQEVKALRGNILSDNGQLLATSLPFFRLAFDPSIASDAVFYGLLDSLSQALSNFFLEKPAEDYRILLEDLRQNNKKYVVLSYRLLDFDDCAKIRQFPIFNQGRYKGGLLFEKIEQRYHPYYALARRTLGLEEDSIKKTEGRGLEYSFNTMLTGKKGRGLFQRTPNNTWRLLPTSDFVRPENGYDIHTSIDIDLQQYINNELKATLQKYQASYGCVLVMEVETGQIKAIANLGRVRENEYAENYNYAVGNQGVTEPGSTLKTASLMALLEEYKNMSINDTVNTLDGEYTFYEECVMRDVKAGGYGLLNIADVFRKSSNIGVSRLIFKNFRKDPQKFIDYLANFGLTQPIDFQIKGAGQPYITHVDDKTWSGCSLPWISIGYEFKISPLQIITFYNAIANGGKLIEPLIIQKITKQGKLIQSHTTKTIRPKICSPETLDLIQNLLEGVVEQGTAKSIFSPKYKISGKTGTTHKLKQGQYIDNYYTSFVGYFPSNKPKYTCMVVVDNPKGAEHFGASVSAPLFKKIADKLYFNQLYKDLETQESSYSLPSIKAGYFPNLESLAKYFKINQKYQDTTDWVRLKASGDTIIWTKRPVVENLIPDVTGMSFLDALYLLENKALNVSFIGQGRVVKQSLIPGTHIEKNMAIVLTLKP